MKLWRGLSPFGTQSDCRGLVKNPALEAEATVERATFGRFQGSCAVFSRHLGDLGAIRHTTRRGPAKELGAQKKKKVVDAIMVPRVRGIITRQERSPGE